MTSLEIKQTIFELLKNVAPDTSPENLKDADDIRHSLEIDSFDALQFVVALEENYGISIPEDDYGKITTLGALIKYIQQKKSI